MPKFRVTSAINYNGEVYEAGDEIELPAGALKKQPGLHVEPLPGSAKPPKKDKEPGGDETK